MLLVKLPLELVEQVISEAIACIGLYKAKRLRLVGKLFNEIFVQAVLDSDLLVHSGCSYMLWREPWFTWWLQKRSYLDVHQDIHFNAVVYGSVERYLQVNPLTEAQRPILVAMMLRSTDREPNGSLSDYYYPGTSREDPNILTRDFSPSEDDILNGALALAASLDDVQSMKRLAQGNTTIYQRRKIFEGVFALAARNAAYNAVVYMLDTIVTPEDKYTKNDRFLNAYTHAVEAASYYNHVHILKLLLGAGKGKHLPSDDEFAARHNHISCAIHMAMKGRHYDLVYRLLNTGYEGESCYLGSVIYYAAECGALDVVRDLVETSPYPQSELDLDRSLEAAVQKNHLETVHYLLTQNLDETTTWRLPWRLEGRHRLGTTLHAAVKTGNLEMIQLLLDAGVPINLDFYAGYSRIDKFNAPLNKAHPLRTHGDLREKRNFRGNSSVSHRTRC